MPSKSYFFSVPDLVSILCTLFTPDDVAERVEDIDLLDLKKRGFNTLLLDVDNTLVPYTQRDASLDKVEWINQALAHQFKIILISNNSSGPRIGRIAKQLGVPSVYFALKPFPWTARDLVRQHHLDITQCCVIGDQLLTDVVMGNWVGAKTILVDPIDRNVSLLKVLQKDIESRLLEWLTRLHYKIRETNHE